MSVLDLRAARPDPHPRSGAVVGVETAPPPAAMPVNPVGPGLAGVFSFVSAMAGVITIARHVLRVR